MHGPEQSTEATVTASTGARRTAAAPATPPLGALWKYLPPRGFIVAAALHLRAVWWHALAVALAVVTLGQSAGMLIGGDRLYSATSYHLVIQVPGGIRTYGLILLLLGVATAFGYGQARAGHGRVLRRVLSLVAGWYVFWLLAIVGTWAVDLQLHGWNGLWLNGLAAFNAILVACAVPPDPAPDKR
jgi:hypothetical protein